MPGKPRIYITIADFYPSVGGAEVQALTHAKSLRERGYDITVVTFHHEKRWPQHEVIEGVPVVRVAGRLLANRQKLPRLLRKLSYLMGVVMMGWVLWQHRHRFDVLHVYQLTLLALPAALVCRLSGIPMLVAMRSTGPGTKVNARDRFSLIAGPLDASIPWLQVDAAATYRGDLEDIERLGKHVTRFVRSLLDRPRNQVVILSSRMKAYLEAHDFQLSHVQLIPNGVDIERFKPANRDAPEIGRSQVVVCVSRLNYEKGIDVLLQAWYLVQKQLPQAKLIIVGEGLIQTQLERLAEALGIANSVEFTGLQRDVPAQLHRGDLAVLPSRFEGMPNSLLQAMACGMACVATRVSGSEDIIQHGVNGLLVEPEDYQGMAQALLTLLCNAALARQLGHAARATIEQHYSLAHINDVYEKLYQRITDTGLKPEEQREYSTI